jgi:hypothetical protein
MRSWIDDLRKAVIENLRDRDLVNLVVNEPPTTLALIARGELLVRDRLPYRFDAAQHRILSFVDAQSRGYGACGESAAVFAALALLAQRPTISICYEDEATLRGYAHVRILVDGVVADSYRDRRIDVEDCSQSIDVERLLGASRWRVDVAAKAVAARRRSA